MKNRIKVILFIFPTIFLIKTLAAQEISVQEIAIGISPKELQEHVQIISADSMEGRATGTTGQMRAALYLSGFFKEQGLEQLGQMPEYIQQVPIESRQIENFTITVSKSAYSDENAILLNYTRSEELYKHTSRIEKIVPLEMLADLEKETNILVPFHHIHELLTIEEQLVKKYPENVFLFPANDTIIFNNIVATMGVLRRRKTTDLSPNALLPNIFIVTRKLAQALAGKDSLAIKTPQKIKGNKFNIQIEAKIDPLESGNVVGFIRGNQYPEEFLVITGHYDHLGKNGDVIYNGADDNGSGIAAILEIVEAYAELRNKGFTPKRSVMFVFMTGEEMGLFGSEFFTTHPPVPLEGIKANLNIDMVGRVDAYHPDNPNYIYLIGSDRISPELHKIQEAVNERTVNLYLDYTYNDEHDPNRFYYRSDHYNFAKNGIPVIFYFSGIHEDYHQPSDTFEKLNYERMSV
jgi:hypothetical protein